MRIASFGINEIDKSKFSSDGMISLNKPRYGLYGSTLIKRDSHPWTSWLTFVEDNGYETEKYKTGISYTLNKNAKVLTIDTIDEYFKVLKEFGKKTEYKTNPTLVDFNEIYLDFDKIKCYYDAFHLTENGFWSMRLILDDLVINGKKYLVRDFYSYDCETWIIFNLDCINKGSIQNICANIYNYDY